MSIKTWRMRDRDIVFPVEWIYDVDAVRQRLENRLRLWKGSWRRDVNAGIDWYNIFDTQPTPETIENVVKLELESDEYVDTVTAINSTFDRQSRIISINFVAHGNIGTVEGSVIIAG